jgi:plastocyanin
MLSSACSADPVSNDSSTDGALVSANANAAVASRDEHGRPHVSILDDCDPSDPAWNATGGCVLRGGVVTEAEFGAFLGSPLSLSVVGHPAWRNEPSYLRVRAGTSVSVSNAGGRNHTFTKVAQYGAGFVPVAALNMGLTQAPECNPASPNVNAVAPGERIELSNLAAGNHRYQCCIHPWMRALVKVQ